MADRSSLSVVADGSLMDYPLDEDARLDSHGFFPFLHKRWLSSALHLRGSMAVQGAAVNLIAIAHDQTPVGTLPHDQDMLARLLRISADEWRGLMAMPITPLHNWRPCRCGDEVRLMHPVVLSNVEDALSRRLAHERSKSVRAVKMRLVRLREGLTELGISKAVVSDQRLIERMDEWIEETFKDERRTRVIYERAFMHAARLKWLNAEGSAGKP